MALFSFSDISFSSTARTINSSNNLLADNRYAYNILRYPIDLGEADKGHYMVIHINQQRRTQFKGKTTSESPTIFENRTQNGTPTVGGTFLSVLDNISTTAGSAARDILAQGGTTADQFRVGFTRTIERTTDTIALYMPDTLAFTYNQAYSDLSLNSMLTAGLATTASLAEDLKNVKSLPQMIEVLRNTGVENLSPVLAQLAQNSDLFRAGFAAFAGKVVNPMMEMIYASPAFREFRFDFMFYPRSEREAVEVQKIINKLRFHQAPEIDTNSQGFFLIPPSEFDIKFYYNGKENVNIPKISTCVLTSIDTDYAPNGFAAYEVAGETYPDEGRTGMPVGIRLGLAFKETEILTKDNFAREVGRFRNTGVSSSGVPNVYSTSEGE